MKLFVVDFFLKNAPWQSERDQGHFSKFVTKYSSQSNAFAINITRWRNSYLRSACHDRRGISRRLTKFCCPLDHGTVSRCNYCKAPIAKFQSSSTVQVAFAWYFVEKIFSKRCTFWSDLRDSADISFLNTYANGLRLPDVLERQELSLNLLSKRVMCLILEKHFVVLEYFPASLKILE